MLAYKQHSAWAAVLGERPARAEYFDQRTESHHWFREPASQPPSRRCHTHTVDSPTESWRTGAEECGWARGEGCTDVLMARWSLSIRGPPCVGRITSCAVGLCYQGWPPTVGLGAVVFPQMAYSVAVLLTATPSAHLLEGCRCFVDASLVFFWRAVASTVVRGGF